MAPLVLSRARSKNKIRQELEKSTTLTAWPAHTAKEQLSEQNTLLLKKTLELLRRTEMLLFVEYVECAIPVLYATYLSILFYLPNAKYYPKLVGRDSVEFTCKCGQNPDIRDA